MKALINRNLQIKELVYISKINKKVVLRVCYDEKGHLSGEKLAKLVELLHSLSVPNRSIEHITINFFLIF
jgi:hypothetical protein